MKPIFKTDYSPGYFNAAMLIMRLGFGLVMIHHGYDKFQHFAEYRDRFMNFLGLSTSISLSLIIFAELVCSVLVALGLFTRLACVVLIIGMVVATNALNWEVFGHAETSVIYIVGYLTILFAGAGRYSIDAAIFKK